MSNFIAYLKTKSFRNHLTGSLCTLIGILLVAFFSLRFYTKHGEGLDVPSLKGLSIARALEKLNDLGLRYEIDSIYIMDKPPGIVTDQDPEEGTFVKDNRTIYLTINASKAPNVKFPEVEFKLFQEAKSILENHGLRMGDTVYKTAANRDVVLQAVFGGQTINAGEILPKGSVINFILGDGRGSEEVDLPDLTGFTLDEAKLSLKGAGLNAGTIIYQSPVTDSANAVVIMQIPMPKDSLSKVKIGTPVNLTLSDKP